ncbi:MAG: lexA2 [Firmicutes bacterium]|nr:lexA2 [Bacillota bacterium]
MQEFVTFYQITLLGYIILEGNYMLEKFGPDVIKTVDAMEKYAQEKGYWPKQKDWNQYAAQYGFYSAGTLLYWGLWDYLKQKFKRKSEPKPDRKIVENVSKTKETLSKVINKQSVNREKQKPRAANIWANKTNLNKIRKATMSTKEFLRLTGLSKAKLCEIELGITFAYNDQIELIADILKTTPEVISEGIKVWDKDRPLPSWKKKSISSNKLSPIQQEIFDFIRNYPHQYPPSIREIAAGVDISSTSTVHHHLVKLEEKGYIVRGNNSARCVVIKENL